MMLCFAPAPSSVPELLLCFALAPPRFGGRLLFGLPELMLCFAPATVYVRPSRVDAMLCSGSRLLFGLPELMLYPATVIDSAFPS